MNTPPRKVDESGLFRDVWRKFNELVDYARSIAPLSGENVRVTRTMNGSLIHSDAAKDEAPRTIQWRGEWDPTESYKENDLVIRGGANPADSAINDTVSILQDGTKAGLYIALRDMEGSHEPHEPPDPDYWETMARFSTPIFTIRHPSSTKKVYIDATGPNGSVVLQLSQCNNKDLRIQEMPVCINGVQKKIMLICSDPYT